MTALACFVSIILFSFVSFSLIIHFPLQVDAGADLIVTQLFYDTDIFLKFVNDCREIGITCPIVPGIMPINNYKGFVRMTGFCKTKVRSVAGSSIISDFLQTIPTGNLTWTYAKLAFPLCLHFVITIPDFEYRVVFPLACR